MGVAALHFHVASLSGFGFVDSVHEVQSHFQPQAAIVRAIFTTWMFSSRRKLLRKLPRMQTDQARSGQWSEEDHFPKRSNPPRTNIVGLPIKVVNDHPPQCSPHALAIFGPQNR